MFFPQTFLYLKIFSQTVVRVEVLLVSGKATKNYGYIVADLFLHLRMRIEHPAYTSLFDRWRLSDRSFIATFRCERVRQICTGNMTDESLNASQPY